MVGLYIFMISVFFGYIGYVIKKWGVQTSISASHYLFPDGTYWFSLITFGYAFSAAILGVLLVDSVLTFLTGTCLGFVAVAYDFRGTKLTENVHMFSARVGVLLSQLSLIFEYHLWYISLITVIIAGGMFFIRNFKDRVWWQEVTVIIGLFTALGIKLFETL